MACVMLDWQEKEKVQVDFTHEELFAFYSKVGGWVDGWVREIITSPSLPCVYSWRAFRNNLIA